MTGLARFCDGCGTAIRIQSKFCVNCGQALVIPTDTSQRTTQLKIFFSYAPEDQVWLNTLDRHLSLFKRQGYITSWHRQHIQPGQEWRQESLQHLSTAHIIVLLVSANFLASDYCYGFEIEQAMKRHRRKEAVVIPILVRPVDWIDAPFAELQALPRNGKPVSDWHDEDLAWAQVVSELRVMVATLFLHTATPSRALPAIWNVPHRRNPLFTGRSDILEQIRLAFKATQAPFTQPLALSGLAGSGKTQIALEYAYLEREHYQAVLWLTASSQETLLSNIIKIAHLLQIVEPDEQNTQNILHAVQVWFAMRRDWLLIIDDLHASALPTIRDELLPEHWHGHVLITTRIQPVEPFARAIMLDTMPDDSLISLADFFIEQGQFEKAEQYYRQALVLYEQSLGSEHVQTINGLRKLATCLQHQKMYDQAEQHFQQAVAICQRQWGMNHVETIESMRQLARCYYLQDRSQQAETILQEILASIESLDWKSPTASQVLDDIVQFAVQERRLELVETLTQRLSTLMTDASQSYHFFAALANAFAWIAHAAIPLLQQVKGHAASQDDTFFQAALLPLIPLIEESLSQIPAGQRSLRADLLMTLASLYALQGDSNTAIVHFQERLAILEQIRGPMHADTIECLRMLLNVLILFRREGNADHHQQALDIYARLQQAQAVDSIIATGICFLLDNLGRFEEALAAIEQAIALDANNSWLYLQKSFILSSLARHEEELQAIEQAIQITPDNWKYYNFKGHTLTKLERHEEALAAYNQALELAPNDPAILRSKGMALIGLGRYEEGLIVLRPAYDLDPDNVIWAILGVSFAEKK